MYKNVIIRHARGLKIMLDCDTKLVKEKNLSPMPPIFQNLLPRLQFLPMTQTDQPFSQAERRLFRCTRCYRTLYKHEPEHGG